MPRGHAACVVTWKVITAGRGVTLRVRPLLTVRGYHNLHRENAQFNFHAEAGQERVSWRPYWCTPPVTAMFNGAYAGKPDWYRSFLYSQERSRGLDAVEDCTAPGELTFTLTGTTPRRAWCSPPTPPPTARSPAGPRSRPWRCSASGSSGGAGP